MFFSSPLAGRNRTEIVPLDMLNYVAEREMLIQVFKEVRRDGKCCSVWCCGTVSSLSSSILAVAVNFNFATTDSIRTTLSVNACQALHFSGHGLPDSLCLEDGLSGLHTRSARNLKDLVSAGGNMALRFVFISACFSKEVGDMFLSLGVPHVVCVKIDSKVSAPALPSPTLTSSSLTLT